MSPLPIQEAARRALQRFDVALDDPPLPIARLSIDVVDEHQAEIVSLRLSEGALGWSCSCGRPRCIHAAQALRLLAEGSRGFRVETGGEFSLRSSQAPLPPTEAQLAAAEHLPGMDLLALSESLEDVVTAVVRTGLMAKDAPSVFESLERLVKAAPDPLPLGVSRWIGRLRVELNRQRLTEVARLLDGASRLVDDLSGRREHAGAGARRLSWLGDAAGEAALLSPYSDGILVELGRELLDGAQRGSIERRYLMDVNTGELYREERVRGRQTVSLGSCPRLVHVGLAEVVQGAHPHRIRLLQYASSPMVSQEILRRVAAHAVRDFSRLVGEYKRALDAFPGLAEPIACVGATRLEDEGELRLLDAQGAVLPLSGGDHPTSLVYLKQRLSAGKIEFVLGRLQDHDGALYLRAIAGGVADGDVVQHFLL